MPPRLARGIYVGDGSPDCGGCGRRTRASYRGVPDSGQRYADRNRRPCLPVRQILWIGGEAYRLRLGGGSGLSNALSDAMASCAALATACGVLAMSGS